MTFTELLREYKVPYKQHGEHHHVTSGWVGVDCPDCSPGSGKFRLGYNTSGGYFVCWVCGPKRAGQVLTSLTGLSYFRAKGLLDGLQRERIPAEFVKRGTYREPKGVAGMRPAHKRYLKARGYDPKTISRLWGVKGIGRESKLGWRLFIPIRYRGEDVSWTTRAIGDNTLRYVSAKPEEEKYAHRDLLYGEDYARTTIIIVEGPLDVWKIGPGAVCTFGLEFTKAQINRMARYSKRYVCFDNQKQAQRRANQLGDALSVLDGETYVIRLESGKDAGEADEKEIEGLQKLLDV